MLIPLWNAANAIADKTAAPAPGLPAARHPPLLGLPFPQLNAIMAGCTECFRGLLLLVGLGARLISVPLMFTMIVACLTAHRETVSGIWADSDAFVTAAPFLFLHAAVIIFTFGPGRFSVDARLRTAAAA